MKIAHGSDAEERSTAAMPQDARPLPLGLIIRVLNAEAEPRQFRLRLGSCILGAGAGANILIGDLTVSRKHASFTLAPDGVEVEDLGSRNGTFYLGQRFAKMVLGPGSRVRLGAVDVAIDADTEALLEQLPETADSYGRLVGRSPTMHRLFAILKRLEGSLLHVLVQGESGVGKELVARAIHAGSVRSDRPLVVVNCGGIARELILSELFGHRRGAFTGAVENRVGAFEVADGGTLFLDEVGELPLDVQPTLLRALESGEVRPVGENQSRFVRVRVIAATNRDLEDAVRKGAFREDLYYRLAVVKLAVPPLRERPEDIELLAGTFSRAAGLGELSGELVGTLAAYRWPGNCRELRNAIESYAALGALPDGLAPAEENRTPLLDHAVGQLIDLTKPYAEQRDLVAERFQRKYLEALMAKTGGNQSEAARISGLERSYLGKLLVRYGIKVERS